MPIEINGMKYYTMDEAAKKLDVHPMTIRRAMKQGRLEYSKPGVIRISEMQLQKYLEQPPELEPGQGTRPREYYYRIIYGEAGNEQGHIEELPTVKTEAYAKNMLSRRLKQYGGKGAAWGRVECRHIDEAPDAWRALD